MQLLFANMKSTRNPNLPTNTRGHNRPPNHQKPKKMIAWGEVLIEQIINSSIVGGIAGISALAAADPGTGWKVAAIAFGLTALSELRKYRNL